MKKQTRLQELLRDRKIGRDLLKMVLKTKAVVDDIKGRVNDLQVGETYTFCITDKKKTKQRGELIEKNQKYIRVKTENYIVCYNLGSLIEGYVTVKD